MCASSFLQRLALGRQVAGGLSGASAGAARQVRHLLSPSLWPGVAHPGGAESDSAPLPWRGGAPRAAHQLFLEEIAAYGGLFDPPSGRRSFSGRLAGQGRGTCRNAVPLQRLAQGETPLQRRGLRCLGPGPHSSSAAPEPHWASSASGSAASAHWAGTCCIGACICGTWAPLNICCGAWAPLGII